MTFGKLPNDIALREELHLLGFPRIFETDSDAEEPDGAVVAAFPGFGEEFLEDGGIEELAGTLGGCAVEVGEFHFHDERADDALGMGIGEVFGEAGEQAAQRRDERGEDLDVFGEGGFAADGLAGAVGSDGALVICSGAANSRISRLSAFH